MCEQEERQRREKARRRPLELRDELELERRRVDTVPGVGTNGTERRRTPMASNTAFEIADGTTAADGSPAPHGDVVGRSMSSKTISGTSGKVRIG